jgi:hypothetical protein
LFKERATEDGVQVVAGDEMSWGSVRDILCCGTELSCVVTNIPSPQLVRLYIPSDALLIPIGHLPLANAIVLLGVGPQRAPTAARNQDPVYNKTVGGRHDVQRGSKVS